MSIIIWFFAPPPDPKVDTVYRPFFNHNYFFIFRGQRSSHRLQGQSVEEKEMEEQSKKLGLFQPTATLYRSLSVCLHFSTFSNHRYTVSIIICDIFFITLEPSLNFLSSTHKHTAMCLSARLIQVDVSTYGQCTKEKFLSWLDLSTRMGTLSTAGSLLRGTKTWNM